ncbi:MAG TPA: LysM peptidoglycan-binding domain-containing protein [Phytomonospora sp.]
MAEGRGSTGTSELGAIEPGADPHRALPIWLARTRAAEPPEAQEPCRFLAAVSAEGAIGEPIRAVDDANRCVALGDPTPPSRRQQELICLGSAHRSCPRYLRGALLESAPPARARREPISAVVIAGWIALATAIAASFGFLAVRGGMTVALVSPSPAASLVAVLPEPSATSSPSRAPSPIAATPSPGAAETPTPSVAPSARPIPTPTPAATPRPTPRPRPTSDRYAVLDPCPSTPKCWLYTVRVGDNLVSIAHWFGVPLDTVYDLNPWARTTGLRAGQELRLPPPTR